MESRREGGTGVAKPSGSIKAVPRTSERISYSTRSRSSSQNYRRERELCRVQDRRTSGAVDATFDHGSALKGHELQVRKWRVMNNRDSLDETGLSDSQLGDGFGTLAGRFIGQREGLALCRGELRVGTYMLNEAQPLCCSTNSPSAATISEPRRTEPRPDPQSPLSPSSKSLERIR